jgi:hypothetical protein
MSPLADAPLRETKAIFGQSLHGFDVAARMAA